MNKHVKKIEAARRLESKLTSQDSRVPTDDQPTERRVRLTLPPEDVERLRVRAAQHGLSMASYVRMLVLADLDGTASKRPPKSTPRPAAGSGTC